jgi:hypothetical protein
MKRLQKSSHSYVAAQMRQLADWAVSQWRPKAGDDQLNEALPSRLAIAEL